MEWKNHTYIRTSVRTQKYVNITYVSTGTYEYSSSSYWYVRTILCKFQTDIKDSPSDLLNANLSCCLIVSSRRLAIEHELQSTHFVHLCTL
jgi:hypothetical protein